ncbi:hypothetical protein Nepgr_015122 [Nepenthes gracilis]|uniref:Uncharacterized protein n=1 Tax=Nepenthes gracilis TaxID=150966 RepID=A0AAD3SMM6_NEPGR|nr:hypothetical protein Nepgr_015122 [Nepenthes gracilis]
MLPLVKAYQNFKLNPEVEKYNHFVQSLTGQFSPQEERNHLRSLARVLSRSLSREMDMDNGGDNQHKMENSGFSSVNQDTVNNGVRGEDDELLATSVEKIFESKKVPPWRKQLTFRAFFVSFVLSVLFSVIVMKLNLTTGVIPSLNVAAGLLGFFFVKTWTTLLEKSGLLRQPFTRQENTVIQTCVVAASGIAFSGKLSSLLRRILCTFPLPPPIVAILNTNSWPLIL